MFENGYFLTNPTVSMQSIKGVLFVVCLLWSTNFQYCNAKATVEQIGSFSRPTSSSSGNNNNSFRRFQSSNNNNNGFSTFSNEATNLNDLGKIETASSNDFFDRHSRIGFIRKVLHFLTVTYRLTYLLLYIE